jgi:hypothetical protein
MTHADSPADRRPPTEEDGFVKWLQLGLLLVIAAALLWGAESVRSFPARVFSGPRPPQLDEGRRAFASHNYTLAATLFAEVIERSSGTHAREAALLLAEVRLAQGSRWSAFDVLRQHAPEVNADSFVSAHAELVSANAERSDTYLRAMRCDVGDPRDSTEARWCERYLQYLRNHPNASFRAALLVASGGHLDSLTEVNLRENEAWWRSYCARTHGRSGEYEPYQQACPDRRLAR